MSAYKPILQHLQLFRHDTVTAAWQVVLSPLLAQHMNETSTKQVRSAFQCYRGTPSYHREGKLTGTAGRATAPNRCFIGTISYIR